MPAYDRHYDFGMRGFRDVMRPVPYRYGARSPYDRPYFGRYDAGYGRGRDMPRHVTARYNMDYVTGVQGDRYPHNPNMYAGDRMQRNGDYRYYRQPYMTDGGTRTMRGSNYPTGYDYPDYGPNYGGRYPDEL